jgi:hypothetical protein
MPNITGKRPFSLAVRFALVLVTAATAFGAVFSPEAAHAGGSGENVFLIVNQRSWGSLSAANHYIRLRRIPAINVMYFDWPGEVEQIDSATFREKLLGPIVAEMERRRIADHIDYLVYSTDFPWAVDFAKDAAGVSLPNILSPTASLTGATYLYQYVMGRRLDFLSLEANHYFRRGSATEVPKSHGFRSWYGWGRDGELLETGGERFVISAMLGVTSGRGNSVREVIDYLTTAAGADGTSPAGTIYYLSNGDVRSTTRAPLFAAAVAAVKEAGVAAEQIDGELPQRRPDVAGAMLGTAQFDWKASRSRIVPGAICEHLTSAGGILSDGAGQTPLTDLLRAGAALSCGAVAEPYAVPNKFPSAYMHLHYVRGCSAAEAFYQATHSPYQLLLVGDALCRPWAKPPTVTIPGIADDGEVSGPLTLNPTVDPETCDRLEYWVDGILIDSRRPEIPLGFDTRKLPDGAHELRVTAVGPQPIETRGTAIREIRVANSERTVELKRTGTGLVRWGETLKLEARASDALGIALTQGTRRLAVLQRSEGVFEIDPRVLGRGPVTLQAVAIGKIGPSSNVISASLELDIEPNDPSPTYAVPPGSTFRPSMSLVTGGGKRRIVTGLVEPDWLEALGVAAGDTFTQTGFLTVDEDGVYQFHLSHNLDLRLLVDDVEIGRFDRPSTESDYAAAVLRRGLHKIELRATVRTEPRLDIRFGLRGTRRLQPVSMTHIPEAAP